jgi:hypothetical protein
LPINVWNGRNKFAFFAHFLGLFKTKLHEIIVDEASDSKVSGRFAKILKPAFANYPLVPIFAVLFETRACRGLKRKRLIPTV